MLGPKPSGCSCFDAMCMPEKQEKEIHSIGGGTVAAILCVLVCIGVAVCATLYKRKGLKGGRPRAQIDAMHEMTTVDAPISLHNVSAIPMDMRPNDAALAAAAVAPA